MACVTAAALLTTGQAAKLCSVKPDTLLKWIKRGRISASRTAGGHFRVDRSELLEWLSRQDSGKRNCCQPLRLCSRPTPCWEYMNHSPGTECQECVVYRVRAMQCFRLVRLLQGAGHAARFCAAGSCQQCPYYRRVQGLPAQVLVIARDEAMLQDLSKGKSAGIAFRFARRGYDASAVIDVFRPAFVIITQEVLESLGIALLEALASDPRTAGAKIVIAVRKGTMGYRVEGRAIFATVEAPFNAEEIAALIDRIPVEPQAEDPSPRL
jgi:excisionase family DNA binding protein